MVRFKYSSLFSFLVALLLMAGPLVGNVLAATDSGHVGHDSVTAKQSNQNSSNDMSNMDMSGQNNSKDMGNMNMTGQNNSRDMGNMDMSSQNNNKDMGNMDMSGQNKSQDMNNMDGMNSNDGHGENGQEAHVPPNWPLIYGFIGFNLLVIIIAALMKNRSLKRNGVN